MKKNHIKEFPKDPAILKTLRVVNHYTAIVIRYTAIVTPKTLSARIKEIHAFLLN